MNSTLPKFRHDLTIRQRQTDEGVVYTVKDTVSGEFFRFREAEHFIAQHLDGQTSLESLRRKVEAAFGASLSAETLSTFVKTLSKAGLLDTGNTAVARRSQRPKRIRGSLLSLRFNAFDPSRLFDRLIYRIRFFFTPGFVVMSGLIILLASWTLLEEWNIYLNDLPRLYTLNVIPLFFLVNFLVVVGHEFGHGLTCKYFGGEVREIGFLLIYFQPALYCNVSDAWLFPERWKRLWVGFAGPYFELFLWALAVFAWRLTDVDTWINYIGLIVMTSSGIKTLVNFNPLIKLDGYYLLSDALETPNLRMKSFQYVGYLLRRLTGAEADPAFAVSPRERRIFIMYGVVATVFSFFILGYATIQMGGFLIDNQQPMPLAAFVSLVGLRFRDRLGRLFGNRLQNVDDEDTYVRTRMRTMRHAANIVHAAAPAEQEEALVEVARPAIKESHPIPPKSKGSHARTLQNEPSTQRRKRLRNIVLGYAAAFGVVILLFGYMELRVGGPFMILPVHNADVRSSITGIVEEVYVTEGQKVRAGDLVALLSDRESRAELQKTRAQIQQSRARLSMLEVGPTREEVEVAKTAVVKANDRLKYAQSRLTRNKMLFEKKALSALEYEKSQEETTVAAGDLAEAQNKLKLLLRGARPQEIDGARAEIAALEAQERRLEDVLQRVEVRSHVAGVVATPAQQLEGLIHQAVDKGSLLAKVYDMKQLVVEIGVSEKDIADVAVGQKVAFKARAYPDETFYGTVTATATTASAGAVESASNNPLSALSSSSSSGTTVLVRTVIDNSSLRLKPGMTGQAKVFCGERTYASLIARRLARVIRVEFWSWW